MPFLAPHSRSRNLLAISMLLAVFVFFQFSREFSRVFYTLFYHILSYKPIGRVVYSVQLAIGYQVYSPAFWSKILYSVLLMGMVGFCLWLFARNHGEARFMIGMVALALGGSILLNMLGKLSGSVWVETLSRDSFEFILSPLPVVFLLPVLQLYRMGNRQQVISK